MTEKHNGDEEAFRALGLRPATPADEAFLRTLFASTRVQELALMDGNETLKEAFITMQFGAQSQQYAMSYPDADHSIVLWREVPIGRLLLDRGEGEFTLVDIALLPTNRGAGIGSHLIEDFLREAATVGKPVKLSVWHSNPARRLYLRKGFLESADDGVYCEMWWNRDSNGTD